MEPGLPKEEAGGQEEEWARDSEVNAEEERDEWAGREPEWDQAGNASAQNAGQRLLISCASHAILRPVQPVEPRWCANDQGAWGRDIKDCGSKERTPQEKRRLCFRACPFPTVGKIAGDRPRTPENLHV